MQVIPNKYLQTNLNRIEAEPGSLLKAENVRIDGGRIRRRNGQQLLVPEDPFGIANVTGYTSMLCRKLFFYNGKVWGYFQNQTDGDVIAYFDTTVGNGQWRCTQFSSSSFNYNDDQIPPQFQESNRRLLFSSIEGIKSSPKLTGDDLFDNDASTIQTQMRQAGCVPALPFTNLCTIIDTAATYNANWLPTQCAVSYRHVWKYVNANGTLVYGGVSDIKRIKNDNANARAVQLDITIPYEITNSLDISRFSCEIYRTLTTTPAANGIAPDPGDQMFLACQIRPTTTDKSNGWIRTTDIVSPAALQGPLYTNETEQGAASSRIRPPIAQCLGDFSGSAFYGNIKNRWNLPFQLVSVRDSAAATQVTLQDKDIIVLAERCYQAKDTVAIALNQFTIDPLTGYANLFNRIANTLSNLHTKYNQLSGRGYFNLMTNSGPDDITGKAYLQQISDAFVPSGFTPYIGLYRDGGWPAGGGAGPSCIVPTPLITESKGKGYKITAMLGVGSAITFTLNAAPDFVVGDTVNLARLNTYQDLSLAVGSQGNPVVGFTPGQYVVSNVVGNTVTLTGVTGTINRTIGIAPFATTWTCFGVMHAVMQGSTGLKSPAIGEQQVIPGRVMYSANYEPQNAPALNYFDIGASDKAIIGIKRLNRSLFVFKEDGLFRVNGDYQSYSVQEFDPDIVLVGPDLVDSMGGSLYCMTSRGVYRVSENETERISYQIQNLLDVILVTQRAVNKRIGHCVGNHADNSITFWLSGGEQADIAFVYDGEGWTQRTDQANGSCCGLDPDSQFGFYRLYTMKNYGSGWLTQQRRSLNGYDMADEQLHSSSVSGSLSNPYLDFTVSSDAGSIFAGRIPVGSVIVPTANEKARAVVTAASDVSSGVVRLTATAIDPAYPFPASWGSVTTSDIYLPIYSEWQYNIIGSQDIDQVKLFTEFSIVFQQPYFSTADVGFASDISPSVQWLTDNMKGFVLKRDSPSVWPITQSDDVLADKNIKCLVARSKARSSQLRCSFRNRKAIEYISAYGYTIRTESGGTNIERNNS